MLFAPQKRTGKRNSSSTRTDSPVTGTMREPRAIKIALLLLALGTPKMAVGTSIVAIKLGGPISISTDSKQVFPSGHWKTSCKIYRFGNLYFAADGIVDDAGRGFHYQEIVAANFTESDDFLKAVKSVENAMAGAFQVEMERMRGESEADFRFETKSGAARLEIIFAEVREGVPQLAEFSLPYSTNTVPPLIPTEIPCPDHCSITMGHNEHVNEFLSTHQDQLRSMDQDALSRVLVENEIEKNPAEVGPPIVTMRLESTGVVWVANDMGCPIVIPGNKR